MNGEELRSLFSIFQYPTCISLCFMMRRDNHHKDEQEEVRNTEIRNAGRDTFVVKSATRGRAGNINKFLIRLSRFIN